jgi:hypothetical protein
MSLLNRIVSNFTEKHGVNDSVRKWLPPVDFLPEPAKPVTSRSTIERVSQPSTPQNRQLTLSADGSIVRVTYGRDRIGADIANMLVDGQYWVIQCVWGEGEIDGVELVELSDEALPAGSSVRHYLGTSGQTVDSWLVAAFNKKGITYTDALPGVAYSVLRIPTSKIQDAPAITAIIRGRKLFDPRTGQSSYTTNPALALADILRNPVYGGGRTLDEISVAAAANACDQLVEGTRRRSIGLTLASQEDLYSVADTLRTYAGCWIVQGKNGLKLVPDRPSLSVRHFSHNDGSILKMSPLRKAPIADAPTVMTISYTDTTQKPWAEARVSAYASGVLEGTRQRRESVVSLPGVQTKSQAMREAIERLNKLTLFDLSCEVTVFDDALSIEEGDVVTLSHPVGLASKLFRVMSRSGEYGRHNLTLTEYDIAAYSDVVVDEPTTPDVALPSPTVPLPVSDLAVIEELVQLADGTWTSRLRVNWSAPEYPYVGSYRVQVKQNGAIWASGTILEYDDLEWASPPVKEGLLYEVSVITVSRLGWPSSESTQAVTAVGKLLPPTDVENFIVSVQPDGLRCSFDPAGDIDLRGYEIRIGPDWSTGSVVWTGAATRSVIPLPGIGRHHLHVKATDRSGNSSVNPATYIVDISSLSAPAISHSVGTSSVLLTWGRSTGTLPLSYYEVRHGDSWEDGVFVARLSSQSLDVRADWSGARKFWVAGVDSAGYFGTESSVLVDISKPETPVLTGVIADRSAILSWADARTSLTIGSYEVRYGDSWESATFVTRISARSITIPAQWEGTRKFWVKAYDLGDNESEPGSTTLTIEKSSAPITIGEIVNGSLLLSWSNPAGTLPVVEFEVRQGETWATASFVTRLSAQNLSLPVTWGGERTFLVAGIDSAGNVGLASATSVIVQEPSAPVISAEVIDNNVLLRWSDAMTTLPIESYEIRKGSVWESAQIKGVQAGRFSALFESVGGSFVYMIRAKDRAGNLGPVGQITTMVSQPPDFVLNYDQDSTFAGARSNLIIEGGAMIGPVNTTETWETHFTARAWATPQAQIDAGYPIFVQPASSPGYYEEVIDYGTTIGSTVVTVTAEKVDVSPGVTITPKISVSNTSDTGPWTDFAGVWQALGTNFRWVKVRLDITGSATALVKINRINVRMSMKLFDDAGMGYADAADSGGTVVPFNKPFVDIQSITVTPKGTTPVTAIYDFADAPNPTSFKVLLFNSAGARVSGAFSWSAKGV